MLKTAKQLSCPVCCGREGEVFCATARAPVLCHLRYTDAKDAAAASTGEIGLVRCRDCGMVYNRDFQPEKLTYEVAYDNALHFSPHFRSYAETLASDLCQRYGVLGVDVVDIGCGDGYFLNLLCEAGGNRGWGFDPTAYERLATTADVRLIRGYFDAGQIPGKPKLITCRHVLEHLPEPQGLLDEIRAACEPLDTVVYFEVPDGRFTLERGGYWDILYEHCCYYTPDSIRRLFEDRGFQVNRISSGYHDQFLQLEAVASAGDDEMTGHAGSDTAESVHRFADEFERTIAQWQRRFEQFASDRSRVVLWGAGTKGVMFLNIVRCGETVAGVVDLNPGKQGTYVAGTSVPVIAPESLPENPPDVVVLMNPAYREEVAQNLSSLGLRPELLTI